jgi:hypothetical protein
MVVRPHINRGLSIFIFYHNFPLTRRLALKLFPSLACLVSFTHALGLEDQVLEVSWLILGGNFCN